MSGLDKEEAVAETTANAQSLLFDKEGNRKQPGHYVALLTLHTVLRPVSIEGSRIRDLPLIHWRSRDYVYDPGLAEVFIQEALSQDAISDQIVCQAGAVILDATGGIFDDRLREYVVQRLNGDLPQPARKGRGRSSLDNSLRDTVIAGWLIPPLLKRGFRATRNEATEDPCGCSIVSEALQRIGIHLSEKRIAEIWGKVSHRFQAE